MAKSDPIIKTVAGNTGLGDGALAVSSWFCDIVGIAVDGAGNLYIADQTNHCIRKVDAATGNISTVVGNGRDESTGDGGLAIQAMLNKPGGIAKGQSKQPTYATERRKCETPS